MPPLNRCVTVMTWPSADILNRLSELIRKDSDRDVFQDTLVWMYAHPTPTERYEIRFRVRFHYAKLASFHRPIHTELLNDIPSNEPYDEDESDETVEDVLKDFKDAIFK